MTEREQEFVRLLSSDDPADGSALRQLLDNIYLVEFLRALAVSQRRLNARMDALEELPQ